MLKNVNKIRPSRACQTLWLAGLLAALGGCHLERVDNVYDDIAKQNQSVKKKSTSPKTRQKPFYQDNIILETAYHLTNTQRLIVRGSCWDYVNAVYNRAGYPPNRRKVVFKSSPKGPFAVDEIRPGDWLYFTNHNYKNNPHSSLFIRWQDKSKKLGLMLSYAGEGRNQPASYQVYNLKSVYQIIRPDDF